ncbi:MAG: ABC transporter permease [Acidimicrobiia bacterium]
MSWSRAWIVARIDLRRLLLSRDYWMPLLFLSGIFFVFMPAVLLSIVTVQRDLEIVNRISDVLATLPGAVSDNLVGDTPRARGAYALAVYLIAPIAIVVPLTISSAVAASSIVGERERGTGEFLAHSPLTEREIYVGKIIASLIPGFMAALGGFAVYSLIVNLRVGPLFGGWFFPTTGWWVLIFWVMPPFLAVAISVIVRVSGRVQSTVAAQQAATLVSLPIILGSYAVSSGVVVDPTLGAFVFGVVMWVLATLGLVRGSRVLRRDTLLGVGIETR